MSDNAPVVLVIEDERPLQKFLRVTLESQNYAVIEAARGEEGLRHAPMSRPDLVILHSNVKGTNHECARLAYPDFLRELQPEYDAFLATIAAVDPDYVFTDYGQR